MGGIIRGIFGGPSKSKQKSQQSSSSGNYAYPQISAAYGPAMGYTAQSGNMLGSLLGVGGGGGGSQQGALDAFAKGSGMDFILDQGTKAIEGSRAGRGMLQSGGTGKALIEHGQKVGSTYLQQYVNNLLEHARLGIGAGGLIGSTGGWSKGTGTSSGSGTGEKRGLLPSLVGAIAGAKK